MGKITGFLEFARVEESSERVELRLRHHREFVQHLSPEQARQQGSRCIAFEAGAVHEGEAFGLQIGQAPDRGAECRMQAR